MKYLFTGNRINVLNEMVKLKLDVEILPPQKTREDYVKEIVSRRFKVFVSNGCPFILPVSEIKKPNQLFINVHPSLLPAYKGKNPIREAFKDKAQMGATCHHMIDEVDSGEIIAQAYAFPDMNDLNDCYRKCFEAEAKAFWLAYQMKFQCE